MNIKEVQERHQNWCNSVGWDKALPPLEALMLIVSECGEAANECRGDVPTEKLGLELADIILRTLSMAKVNNIDIEACLEEKMKKNESRGNAGRTK